MPFQHRDKYEIIEELGSDHSSTLYKCLHKKLEEIHIIKVPKIFSVMAHFEHYTRLKQVARAAQRIRHENIAAVFDLATDDHGQHYVSMEHFDGIRLSEILVESRLDIDAGISICDQILQGLAHLHSNGICHGNLTPANILVRPSRTPHTKIIGLDTNWELDHEDRGSDFGNARFMSPERIRNRLEISMPDDIFAAGAIFYWILTGTEPFDAVDTPSIPAQLLGPPKDFRSHPEIPPVLQRLVASMLEPNPSVRPLAKQALKGWLRHVQKTSIENMIEASIVVRDTDSVSLQLAYIQAMKETIAEDEELEEFCLQLLSFLPENQFPQNLLKWGPTSQFIFFTLSFVVIAISLGSIVSMGG